MKKELVNALKTMLETCGCFAITWILVTLYEGMDYSEILNTCLQVYAYFAIGYTTLAAVKYVARTLKDAFRHLEKWAVSEQKK